MVGFMRRIRRILVAIKNPAARALPAVAKAAQLARAFGAELVLFHAISTPLYLDADVSLLNDGLADAERTTRNGRLEQLEAIARRLRRKGVKVAVSAEWDYPIYEAIIRETGRLRADLIVAEQHAGWRIAPSLLHLTDWELLRMSPVPVLLVKRPGPYRRPVVLAAVDPDHSYGKSTRLDTDIVLMGAVLAGALRGALHVVHAYVPVPITAFAHGTVLSGDTVARLQARAAATARDQLQRLLARQTVPKSQRHIVGRHPVDAIEEVATRTRSAVVIMGAISRSGLERLLIGNTAEKVLEHLPCDLLIVKPPRLAIRVPRSRRGARYVSIRTTVAGL
jgi:universal stress protein E